MSDTVLIFLLVLSLGAPDYVTRETAHATLKANLPATLPVLVWGKYHPDAEIATRCRLLVEWHFVETVEAKTAAALKRFHGAPPWLDALPKDWPDRYTTLYGHLALARDKSGGNSGPPCWDEYRLATALYVKSLFRAGSGMASVEAMLDQMADHDLKWIAENGKYYSPPLALLAWDKR